MDTSKLNAFRLLAKILYALAIVFVVWFVIDAATELREQDARLNWGIVAASFAVSTLGQLFSLLVWWRLTAAFDIRLPLIRTGRAWFVSRLGRYIPGKIPFFLMRIAEYEQFSKKIVAVAFALEYVMSLLAACFVVLAGLALAPAEIPDVIRTVALICACLFCVVLYPPFLKTGVNFVFTRLGRAPIETVPSFGENAIFVFYYTLVGFVHGLGFYLLLCAVAPVPIEYYPIVTGLFYAAGLIGIAVLVAPGGLGITEGVLFFALPLLIAKTTVVVGAIGIRLTITVGEVLCAAAFYLLDRSLNGSDPFRGNSSAANPGES